MVFAYIWYIVDSGHFERSPSAKKELSSCLSTKRSEKGDRVQFVLQHSDPINWVRVQHHSPDITGMWKAPRMRRKTKPKIASLSKQRDTRWCAFLCILRHLNLSFFKQKPFIYKVFLWCDGPLKFILSEKKISVSQMPHCMVSDRGLHCLLTEWSFKFWIKWKIPPNKATTLKMKMDWSTR